MSDERLERLLALKSAAERIADASDPLGQRARREIVTSSGLSPQNVELALDRCLEHRVGRSTLSGMVRQQPLVPRSHVLLSANVFVAPFRAIALALCQSPRVYVRASRRSPVMTQLLLEGSGGAFELQEELSPQAGDPFWVYGSDATIENLRRTLPVGVRLHAHGAGMGAAVFRENPGSISPELAAAVEGLALDTVLFDQRGCLSPRVVFVEGTREFAETICSLLVSSLERLEEKIPRGALSEQESADALRHEATMTYVGSSVVAGMGLVFLDPVSERVIVPPIGRYLHVCVTENALPLLQRFGSQLTNVAFFDAQHLPGLLHDSLGPRRYVAMGQMQTPAFDGPVDLRHGWDAELL